MAIRLWRKAAMMHKIETTLGEDASPAVIDAIIATNITFTPIEAEEVNRDLILPYLGNQGAILAAEYGKIEFDIEIAGAGAAGTVPKYGSLLRICGLAETITVGTKVEYDIIETGIESGTLYFNPDGVQHIFLGSQANVAMTFAPKGIPKFRFTIMGLLGDISDTVLPSGISANWTRGVKVSKVNTVMSLFGWTAVAESLALDLGNTVTPRFLIGDERMIITDRKSTGTAVVEARTLATVDWFAISRNSTRGALSIVHGKTAGNIVEVTAPAVEIGKPSQGQTEGILNYSLPMRLCVDTTPRAMKITVR